MLYLEDYLEMIENLPMEMKDKFTEMREMDLQVSNSTDSLEGKVDDFFKMCASGNAKSDWKDEQMNKIKGEFSKALEDADEKVQLANQIYELVERHLRKLDQEVLKFKMELEADNAGITEVLEKRLLEPDHSQPQQSICSRPEKRKYSVMSSQHSNKQATPTMHHNYPASVNTNHTHPLSIHNNTTPNNTSQQNSHLNRFASSSSLAAELSRDTTISNNSNSNNKNNVPSFTRALNSNNMQQHTQHHSNLHHNNTPNLTYEHHHQTQPKINIGGGSNAAIAVAASRAIGATVEMQQGRRTSSMKASYEAYKKISKVLPMEKEMAAPSSHLSQDNKITIRGNKRLVTLDKYAPSLKIRASLTPNNSSSSLSASQQGIGARSASYQQQQQMPMQQTLLTTNEPVITGETELTASGWHADPNEPRYCICNDVSYGDMVGCDNEDCPLEWFHYGCVGLQQAPRGKWYCPQCTSAMKRRGRK